MDAYEEDDLDYIDSEIDTLAQHIRHYFDITDDEVIRTIRDSLNRLEEAS